ncbi:MAG: hypothetical protein CMK59_00400, partial [Proteobacteria bacterium]|nr:hypothetical protein [Pseudomonadota bacterium]
MSNQFYTIALMSLCLTSLACRNNEDPEAVDGKTDSETDGDSGGSETTSEEEPTVGDPVGELVAIDHQAALSTVVDNVTDHIDGLESSIKFLEGSKVIENFFGLFSDQDEDAGTCTDPAYTSEWDCENAYYCTNPDTWDQWSCEHNEACSDSQYMSLSDCEDAGAVWDYGSWVSYGYTWSETSPEFEPVEIDLSELRDGLEEALTELLMLEAYSEVSEDGLSI